MNLNSSDFYDLESDLSNNELTIRDSIREFSTSELMPNINSWFHEGRFPDSIISEFGRLKTLGSTISGYGCPGLNYTTYGLIMKEIEHVDSGLRSFVSVQGALCMFPIFQFGTEEQKKKHLEPMSRGEIIGCFGLTEPDHGSNPAGMETQVRDDGDSFILNGHKKWLTNGTRAHIAIVWAKDEDEKIIGLIVDTNLKGIEKKEIKNKYSLRTSDSSEYIFQDCRVPKSQQLQVSGFKGPFSCLNLARFGISWGALGAASACFEEALQYSKKRIQFSKPLARFQLIQAKLSNMCTEITKGQLLSQSLALKLDNRSFRPDQISMAKMNNVSQALKISRESRDILGAVGITDDFHTMRHMCNLETVNTYEGTEDIHRLIIGQSITGKNAFV